MPLFKRCHAPKLDAKVDPFLRQLIPHFSGWALLLVVLLVTCYWPGGLSPVVKTWLIGGAAVLAGTVLVVSLIAKFREGLHPDAKAIAGINTGISVAVLAWTALRAVFVHLSGTPQTVDQVQGIAVGVLLGVILCFLVFVVRRLVKNR